MTIWIASWWTILSALCPLSLPDKYERETMTVPAIACSKIIPHSKEFTSKSELDKFVSEFTQEHGIGGLQIKEVKK